MKKALSVFLAVLMIFSVFGATVAFAAEEEEKTYYTVTFIYIQGNNEEITEIRRVAEGETVIAPNYPVRSDSSKVRYTFKGWQAEGDPKLYHQNTIPPVTADVTYVAVYSEQPINEETLSFLSVITYIFSQFNRIFEKLAEYFSDIFGVEV